MSSLRTTVLLILVLLFTLPAYACSGTSGTTAPGGDLVGNLRFYIRDESGNPLSGAKVVSQNSPENQLKVTGITNVDGMVQFNGIKAGRYEFQISRFDYEPQVADVTVSAGTDIAVTITLQKAEQG